MENVKLAYSVPELAKLLSIGRSAAYTLVNSSGFPKITIGRRVVIPADPLRVWIDKHALPMVDK